jgi:hypothetical protein
VARDKDETAWSIIAHAKATSSVRAMRAIIETNTEAVARLPISHKRRLGLCCQ